ncbi:MAG TPA: DUF3333 domain-containing protein, partial [Nitrosomonas sp.]|nr:DUF3333 domain-containing protein [Nitrosomonas sp.]
MNKLPADKPVAIDLVNASLAKRHASEKLFQRLGLLSLLMGLTFLFILFFSIISKGYTAFQQTFIQLEIDFDAQSLGVEATSVPEILSSADYGGLVKKSMREMFP